MSTISIEVSDTLHTRIVSMAEHEGVSPNQFVAETLAEKVDEAATESYSEGARAVTGSGGSDSAQSVTIFHNPSVTAAVHDHLAPYSEG